MQRRLYFLHEQVLGDNSLVSCTYPYHYPPVIFERIYQTILVLSTNFWSWHTTSSVKCVHGQAPSYLSRLLKTQCQDERTRRAKEIRLYQPTSKKAIGTCAFQVGFLAAPQVWNELPANVRMSTSLSSYKTQLKTHLFINYYECK